MSTDYTKQDLEGASMQGTKAPRGNFKQMDLTGIDLRGSDLTGANFHGSALANAKLMKADFTKADLAETILEKADLSRAILKDADLRESSLLYAILDNADLQGADLRGAVFNGASLRKTDFRKSELRGSSFYLTKGSPDFSGADLSRADFTNAQLRGADFRGSDLTEASFEVAKLENPDFTGADLTMVSGLSVEITMNFPHKGFTILEQEMQETIKDLGKAIKQSRKDRELENLAVEVGALEADPLYSKVYAKVLEEMHEVIEDKYSLVGKGLKYLTKMFNRGKRASQIRVASQMNRELQREIKALKRDVSPEGLLNETSFESRQATFRLLHLEQISDFISASEKVLLEEINDLKKELKELKQQGEATRKDINTLKRDLNK